MHGERAVVKSQLVYLKPVLSVLQIQFGVFPEDRPKLLVSCCVSTEVQLQYKWAQGMEQELQTQGSVSVSGADAHSYPGLFWSGITAVLRAQDFKLLFRLGSHCMASTGTAVWSMVEPLSANVANRKGHFN